MKKNIKSDKWFNPVNILMNFVVIIFFLSVPSKSLYV